MATQQDTVIYICLKQKERNYGVRQPLFIHVEIGGLGTPEARNVRSTVFVSSITESNSTTKSDKRLLNVFISSTRRSISRNLRFFSRLERLEASLFRRRRSSRSSSESRPDFF
uniref:Uncharacterized protein n=1 Tax=Mesocestoides corti TaxID=53468 RepID=A0A5K3EW17_MESCO